MDGKLIRIIVLTKVVPKARPRIGKYGNIYSPSSKDEQDLGLLILREMKLHNLKKQKGRLNVNLVIGYRGKKVGDIDNIMKFCLDSCNGILWDDDRNIYKLGCEIQEKSLDYLMIKVEKVKISDFVVEKIEKWIKGGELT